MDEKILKVAKEAAIEAGKIIKKYYPLRPQSVAKGPRSEASQSELELHDKGHYTNFATEADLESERKIIQILTQNFPSHNIIAEESGTVDKGSEYSWAIDPIDGTIPFVDGLPVFGVSIGILKDNKPYIGVINLVAVDELYWAVLGKGAFLNGKKIKVRKEDNLEKATIGLDLGHTERIMKLEKFWKPIVERVRYVYLSGAAVYILTNVAKGVMDAFIIQANVWDIAAGVILIEEAGGKVTDMQGNEVDYSLAKPRVICSNNLLHEAILKVYN